jgi:hypothetical protein
MSIVQVNKGTWAMVAVSAKNFGPNKATMNIALKGWAFRHGMIAFP